MDLILCTWHCHAGAGLGPLISVRKNLNATAYIQDRHVPPTLCLKLGEDLNIGFMVRCSHTLFHIMFSYNFYAVFNFTQHDLKPEVQNKDLIGISLSTHLKFNSCKPRAKKFGSWKRWV